MPTRVVNDHVNIRLDINDEGEPEGECEPVVSRHLAIVVEKHVPVKSMWSSLSYEVKYSICQELQGKFRDGWRIDAGWIKWKARKLHESSRYRAKTHLWREHCLRRDRRHDSYARPDGMNFTSRTPIEANLRVNGIGEPQGSCETVVSHHLTSVVRTYVPVESMWSSVSIGVKYRIVQALQGMLRDGRRID